MSPSSQSLSKNPSLKVGEGSFQIRRNNTNSTPTSTSDSQLRTTLKRLLASRPYFIFSIIILSLTLLLFVWLLLSRFQPISPYLFISFDFIICVSFALDVAIRIYIETPSLYFDCFAAPSNGGRSNPSHRLKVMWNWFDCGVVWLSALSFCLYLVSTTGSSEESIDATVEVVLICFRAITSVLRLWVVAKSAGMNYRRTARNTYMTLDDDYVDEEDGFTLSEVIEEGGAEPMRADDTESGSELSEDDLFKRPATTTPAPAPAPQKQPAAAKSTFASMTSKLGATFGLNDSDDDDDDDSDDSGLGEDDLFARPTMETPTADASPKQSSPKRASPKQSTTDPLAQSLVADASDEDEMFMSVIQDPSLDSSLLQRKDKKD